MRRSALFFLTMTICVVGSGQEVWGQGGAHPDLGNERPSGKPGVSPQKRAVANAVALDGVPVGETMADAIVISSLPFGDAGETCDNQDDYDAACDYPSTSPDIVYAFTPAATMQLDIDLCGTAYDSKVFLMDASLNILACNEDYYPPNDPCGGYVARLRGAQVSAGQQVYIVIDGYSGGCGTYQLSVDEFVSCELTCAGDILEGEPTLTAGYNDRFNSGCNTEGTSPAITSLQGDAAGELSFCGVSGFYGTTTEYRDTDWFAITLGATGEVVWQLNAEQTTLGYVIELDCPNPGVYGLVIGGPCESGGLTIIGAPGQSIGLWIAPPVYVPPFGMIGNEYDYEFTLSGLSPHVAVSVESINWGSMKSLYR